MRLKTVERGNFPAKLFFLLVRLLARQRAPDVMRVMLFRREYFGRPFGKALQAVMRGKGSEWTVGERELFAAFTSRLNQCMF